MDSYSEVRRVRHEMSAAAGHDIRKLIAMINLRRKDVVDRIIDPGTQAEQCDGARPVDSKPSGATSCSVIQ
jgi:hypothetical protein